jgi:hypothetical protein
MTAFRDLRDHPPRDQGEESRESRKRLGNRLVEKTRHSLTSASAF